MKSPKRRYLKVVWHFWCKRCGDKVLKESKYQMYCKKCSHEARVKAKEKADIIRRKFKRQIIKCIVCKKPFLKRMQYHIGTRGRRARYLRPSNSKTCSKSCSIKYRDLIRQQVNISSRKKR